MFFQGLDLQYVNIGLGKGLSPDWRQAITWTNVEEDFRRHTVSQAHNKLTNRENPSASP